MSTIHVELLTKARKKIASGKAPMICLALASAESRNSAAAAQEIKDHIQSLLNPHVGLGTWLIDRGYPVLGNLHLLRETRLAWIDWLIEQWRDAP